MGVKKMGTQVIVFVEGRIAPQPLWPSETKDGGKMLQDIEGAVIVPLYIESPSYVETVAFDQTIEARYIADDKNGCCLTLLGFGKKKPLIFSLPHDPTAYPQEQHKKRLASWTVSAFWSILAIDSSNGVLIRNRSVTAPRALLQGLSKSMEKALQTPDFSEIYKQFRAQCDRIPLNTLWRNAVPAGIFGEEILE
ncbi:MAG: hypothetical protein LBO82_06490 [Synergistaceae bacterium]|jgi:hypothetical protein|nr:hypothetical protein [Synergistaceae bacterium]